MPFIQLVPKEKYVHSGFPTNPNFYTYPKGVKILRFIACPQASYTYACI